MWKLVKVNHRSRENILLVNVSVGTSQNEAAPWSSEFLWMRQEVGSSPALLLGDEFPVVQLLRDQRENAKHRVEIGTVKACFFSLFYARIIPTLSWNYLGHSWTPDPSCWQHKHNTLWKREIGNQEEAAGGHAPCKSLFLFIRSYRFT